LDVILAKEKKPEFTVSNQLPQLRSFREIQSKISGFPEGPAVISPKF
jgi:hypothetical protein